MSFSKLSQYTRTLLTGIFITLSFISCEKDSLYQAEEVQEIQEVKETSDTSLQKNASFLRQQESLGGHTIERHVAKSTTYLQNRLNTSSISAASTFNELNQAGQVIVNAINANSSRVNSWLNGSGSRLTLNYTHHRNIGVVLRRGQSNPTPSSRFLVVLQKRSNAPNGYYVLTSYPN
ncbi:RNase A-like domain-containing protein [Aquimarina sp. 2-A2]|uniref:RNase A-like domain-containing protein n=1 Tax=Aquimarina sp. 2-A2 TaxID=3382644 RepID=UPI00387F29E1